MPIQEPGPSAGFIKVAEWPTQPPDYSYLSVFAFTPQDAVDLDFLRRAGRILKNGSSTGIEYPAAFSAQGSRTILFERFFMSPIATSLTETQKQATESMFVQISGPATGYFGFVEKPPFDTPILGQPLATAEVTSPYLIPPIALDGDEQDVHVLDPDFQDLVTLVLGGGEANIRVYDGTYTNGAADYFEFSVTSTAPFTVFDAFPMLGPGKITASGDGYLYGSTARGG